MPGVIRKSADVTGGKNTVGSPNVLVNNSAAVRIGDSVEPHGRGSHRGPVMAEGSGTVFVNNIPLCRTGDVANCGHASSPGSNNVFAG
jgi:uncharacterized Zn-binding protein involved in type VI secretion